MSEMTVNDYFQKKRHDPESYIDRTYFEAFHPEECEELRNILKRNNPNHYGELFDHHHSWDFARICYGWLMGNRPDIFRDLLKVSIKMIEGHNLHILIGHGNIEFRNSSFYINTVPIKL